MEKLMAEVQAVGGSKGMRKENVGQGREDWINLRKIGTCMNLRN